MNESDMTNEILAQKLLETVGLDSPSCKCNRCIAVREAVERLRKQGEVERANENLKIILSNAIKVTTPKCLDCTKVCDTCDNANCQWIPLAKMLIAGVDYDPSDYDFGLFSVRKNKSIISDLRNRLKIAKDALSAASDAFRFCIEQCELELGPKMIGKLCDDGKSVERAITSISEEGQTYGLHH